MKVLSSCFFLISVVLSGCSSTDTKMHTESSHKEVVSQAMLTVCCQKLSEIHYLDLPSETDIQVDVNQLNPAFHFKEGKSYFSAYKLPSTKGSFRVTLTSEVDKTIFVPRVLLLDGNYQITRILDQSVFKFEPAKLLSNDEISGSFTIDRSSASNRNNETYMLIYTSAADLEKSLITEREEARYARAHALVAPRDSTQVIPRSMIGSVDLNIEYLNATTDGVHAYIPQPEALLTPAQETQAVPVMLKETEQYYNEHIVAAVKAGDMKKAAAFYKEAKRLGSPTAEQTFLNSLE